VAFDGDRPCTLTPLDWPKGRRPVTEKSLDVVCIGNAIVDVISHADEDFLDAHGMVKGSMQLIDDEVVHKLYADMPPAHESSGGSAANTAAGLASFGGKVAFIGKVAADQLGEVFTHDIRATGVQYTAPETSDGYSTARCLILVTPDAQRTMNTFLGVSSLISPRDVDASLVQQAQVVYCEGYLWDLPAAKEALVKGMDAATAAGGRVAFTLSDSFCVDRHRAEFLELAEHRVDILFANEAEICSLYETESFDEAADRVAGHCEIACLTRSEKGSVIITSSGERVHVDAARVDKVIDTTGAGDLYAAGFLYGLTNGRDLATSGRLASLAAAECISHIGARPDVSLAELDASA
jgi:sugar/nucleoside kinase (ribokinase family)